MDFRMKITLTLPEEMIKTMGITEDTLFITTYEDGQIHVEPYDEDISPKISPMRKNLRKITTMMQWKWTSLQHWQALLKGAHVRDMMTDMPADLVMPTRDCLTTTITAAESSNSMIILQICLAVHIADVKTDTDQ